MNIAIVLSGGTGKRLGANQPKQYIKVGGRMIISYCMETLLSSECIDEVVVVCEPDDAGEITFELKQLGINTDKLVGFALPGRNRQESILHGLEYVDFYIWDITLESATTWVMIHDAARPLLTEQMIEKCFAAAVGHDGAMPYLPMKDTVYLADEKGCVAQLLNRSRVIAGQAPEVFELSKYLVANQALSIDELLKINGSTEPAILAGMDIVTVLGDENNFKVTTPADLERFESMVATGYSEA